MPLRTKPVVHAHPFVFSLQDCGTGLQNGLSVHLRRYQVWAADDPIVQEHPELFGDFPPEVCRTTPDPSRVIDLEDGRLHESR
jgi:hypothetical protein